MLQGDICQLVGDGLRTALRIHIDDRTLRRSRRPWNRSLPEAVDLIQHGGAGMVAGTVVIIAFLALCLFQIPAGCRIGGINGKDPIELFFCLLVLSEVIITQTQSEKAAHFLSLGVVFLLHGLIEFIRIIQVFQSPLSLGIIGFHRFSQHAVEEVAGLGECSLTSQFTGMDDADFGILCTDTLAVSKGQIAQWQKIKGFAVFCDSTPIFLLSHQAVAFSLSKHSISNALLTLDDFLTDYGSAVAITSP